jgi:GxxExxY protein
MLVNGDLSDRVIGLAIKVHRELGPGLLESTYETCLCFELARAGLGFARQVSVPIVYLGEKLDAGFRADIVIEGLLIVEVKSVQAVTAVHEAQILTYLRLSGCPVGLLLNFNVLRLKDGLRRFALTGEKRI